MVDTRIGDEEVGGVEAGPTVVSFFLKFLYASQN